jgi:YidC/Oxa1 family membrane protein insertase
VNLSAAAAEMLKDERLAQILAAPFFGMDLGVPAFGPNGFAGFAYLILPVLSIVLQLMQQLMATPRVQDPQQKAFTQAMLIMPFVFGYIAFTFPTGAVLYWVVSSVVGVVQQYFTSGWGSLANYLRFLPPDNRPTPTLALASASTGSTSESQPETPKIDFWSVMRPLTEAAVEESDPTHTEQRPSRQHPNPRRRR